MLKQQYNLLVSLRGDGDENVYKIHISMYTNRKQYDSAHALELRGIHIYSYKMFCP